MSTQAYNPALHRFAQFLVAATAFLLVAGGSVTSNDAGLAVPDWPTSFGSYYKIPPMVGGVLFEHGHRMVAQFVGLLTIILAVWMQRTEKRAYMRKLGWWALALVIVQGIFGGLTVLMLTPPPVSSVHALLGQTFFWLTALIALFTSRAFVETRVEPVMETLRPGLGRLSLLLVGSLYLQLLTGAVFRHVWTKQGPNASAAYSSGEIVGYFLVPHLLNVVIVVALLLWTCSRALVAHGSTHALRRPALWLLALLQAQLALGFLAYLNRVEWGATAPQPTLWLVLTTVGHLLVGAFMLAAAVVLAVQARRWVVPQAQGVREGVGEAVSA